MSHESAVEGGALHAHVARTLGGEPASRGARSVLSVTLRQSTPPFGTLFASTPVARRS